MVRSVDWVVTDSGRSQVTGVAARHLGDRLAGVLQELRAACRDRHHPKRLHQLRVATRRTQAALEVFGELVPPKHARWFAKRLRRIRRAAGETRDLDVLLARLADEPEIVAEAEGRRFLARVTAVRDRSRRPLRRLCSKLEAGNWVRRVARLRRRLEKSPTSEPFAAFARRGLPPLLDRFFAQADRTLSSNEAFHDLRIEGKKLRYALEVLGVAVPRAVRAGGMSFLEAMQESLGTVIDHTAAAERFRRWAGNAEVRPHRRMLDRLRMQEARSADKARLSFARWWTVARRRSLRRSFQQKARRSST